MSIRCFYRENHNQFKKNIQERNYQDAKWSKSHRKIVVLIYEDRLEFSLLKISCFENKKKITLINRVLLKII